MSKPVSTKCIYAGKVINVGRETHEMPDGRNSTFEIIRHPGGAAVLPILADGRLLLIKQFRPAIGEMVYEIPAGRLEADELPEECAARELVEEVGYSAGEILPLGSFWSTVGFCDELIYLFLGQRLIEAEQQLEPDELIELCPMTLEEAFQNVSAGKILDSKTQLALFNYQRYHLENDK